MFESDKPLPQKNSSLSVFLGFTFIAIFLVLVVAFRYHVEAENKQVGELSGLTFPESESITAQDLKDSKVPIMLEFSAQWCGPCRELAPVLDAVEKQFGENLRIIRIDFDQRHDLVKSFDVQSIPRMFVIKEGKVVGQTSGYHQRVELVTWLKKFVKLPAPKKPEPDKKSPEATEAERKTPA